MTDTLPTFTVAASDGTAFTNETLRGAPAGPRSDLYALGVVLYEVTTGQHPFVDATTPDEMMHAHLYRLPPLDAGQNYAVLNGQIIRLTDSEYETLQLIRIARAVL